MVGPLDVLHDVVRRLDQAGIEYFLVGSLGAMYYGRPRFTNDIDLVVEIKAQQVNLFSQLFPIGEYYCPPVEVLTDEIVRKGSFNLLHQKSGIKIDMVLRKDTDFSRTEFSRRNKVQLTSQLNAYIATPEDIIIKKLDFYREGGSEKHLIDIREMLAQSKIDENYVQSWIAKLGLTSEWKKVQ
jgi:hypothetical protein